MMNRDGNNDTDIRNDLRVRYCDIMARYYVEHRSHTEDEAVEIRSFVETSFPDAATAYRHYKKVLRHGRLTIFDYEKEAAARGPGDESQFRDRRRHLQQDATVQVLIAMGFAEMESSAAAQTHPALQTTASAPAAIPAAPPPGAVQAPPPPPPPPGRSGNRICSVLCGFFRLFWDMSRQIFGFLVPIILHISKFVLRKLPRMIGFAVRNLLRINVIVALLPISRAWTYYVNDWWHPTLDRQRLLHPYLHVPDLQLQSAEVLFLPYGQSLAEGMQKMSRLDWSFHAQFVTITATRSALGCDVHDFSGTGPTNNALYYRQKSYIPQKGLRCKTLAALWSELHHLSSGLHHDSTGLAAKMDASRANFLEVHEELRSLPQSPDGWTRSVVVMREASWAALFDASHFINLGLPWLLQLALKLAQSLHRGLVLPFTSAAVPSMLTHWIPSSESDPTNATAYVSARHHLRLTHTLTEASLPYLESASHHVQKAANRITTLYDQYPDLADNAHANARGEPKGWIVPEEMSLGIARTWWKDPTAELRTFASSPSHPQQQQQQQDHLPIPSLLPALTREFEQLLDSQTAGVTRWEREGALVRGLPRMDLLLEKQRDKRHHVVEVDRVRPPKLWEKWRAVAWELEGQKWISDKGSWRKTSLGPKK